MNGLNDRVRALTYIVGPVRRFRMNFHLIKTRSSGLTPLGAVYVIDKTWAADLYLIYKLEPKASVCISDKGRMRMFYLAYQIHTFK